ncbi:hypothetical protein ABEB36_003413 [Hypothenemus hampei]|uniref:ZP domain-containing protein n=1 Tax=Hypothenemus hampei TaxID=57062 RepID=A0ABD1FCP1_HYPHA
MNLSIFLLTILVTRAIDVRGYTKTERRVSSGSKQSNADQMVQNILDWLENSYTQNSRRVRQGTFLQYLPPSNTQRPRPFQPGYPPAGYSPQPPFPFPTNPVTGGVTAPDGDQLTSDNDILLPPEKGPGRSNGVSTIFTTPTTIIPTFQTGTASTPVVTTTIGTLPPGYTYRQTTVPTTLPSGGPTFAQDTTQPSVSTSAGTTLLTNAPDSTIAPVQSTLTTLSEGTQTTIREGTTGTVTIQHGFSTTLQTQPGSTQTIPSQSTVPAAGIEAGTTTGLPQETVGTPEGSTTVPVDQTSGITLPASTSAPSGFTTSTSPSETSQGTTIATAEVEQTGTTVGPEANTIPGTAKGTSGSVDEDDSKHPPHIHAIDVQCSKEMMTINIEFNRVFNGVIYSKGFFSNPECRYVLENSGQVNYTFTVSLDKCGTQFVNAFDTQNQSYLENILVLQNELGIQEVWDTVRSVRCLWEGNLKDTLSVAFSIGMLSQEIITFSGDTAMAKLDVVLGRGPFGEPANSLVKIGEQMTLVISVSGDPGFDLQVKDCKAVDVDGKNSVALTDEDGCILKPKLFGAFQKTRETGNSGASIIAYAYFNAFKFPDQMDLMIECNIELCKSDCGICTKEGQQVDPAKKRRKRDVSYNATEGDWVTMGKLVRVVLPEELNQKIVSNITNKDNICVSLPNFVIATTVLVTLLVITSLTCLYLWAKRGEKFHFKY